MTFKAKLRKIGNSQGVYIPKKVITGYNIGDVITLSLGEDTKEVITPDIVITKKGLVPERRQESFNTEMCSKHIGSMKGTCGCK